LDDDFVDGLAGWQYGEAIRGFSDVLVTDKDFAADAILAIKQALPLPVQEPTPWRDMVVVSLVREGINKHKARELADHFAAQPVQEPVGEVVEVNNDGFRCEFNRRLAVGTKLYIAPPLPVQEPWGACVSGRVFVGALPEHVRKISEDEGAPIQWLYTTAAQRPWVGLTEFQFAEIYNKWNDSNGSTPWGLNQALEAKLKEINK
jgi:hypothetical protein